MLSIRTVIMEPRKQTEENHSNATEDKGAGNSGRNSSVNFVEFVDLIQIEPF